MPRSKSSLPLFAALASLITPAKSPKVEAAEDFLAKKEFQPLQPEQREILDKHLGDFNEHYLSGDISAVVVISMVKNAPGQKCPGCGEVHEQGSQHMEIIKMGPDQAVLAAMASVAEDALITDAALELLQKGGTAAF